MKRLPIVSLLCLALLSIPFAGAAAQTAAPVKAFVSVLPLKYFLERIGGERVQAQVMVGPGRSPATYEPTPKQMADLSRSRLYYRVGVPFETVWMERIAVLNPAMQIVDLREGLELRPLADHHHDHDDHHHDHPAAEEAGEELDPHVWTDPQQVKKMAERIRDTLSAVDPAGADAYQNNFLTFAQELEDLDRRIRQMLAPVKARRFLVFHPAWGYFAAAYGLEQIAIESSGKEPGPRGLARLIDQAKSDGISVIFVQPQFSRTTASTIAKAIAGQVVAIDPLAEDYLANMQQTAEVFARTLDGTP